PVDSAPPRCSTMRAASCVGQALVSNVRSAACVCASSRNTDRAPFFVLFILDLLGPAELVFVRLALVGLFVFGELAGALRFAPVFAVVLSAALSGAAVLLVLVLRVEVARVAAAFGAELAAAVSSVGELGAVELGGVAEELAAAVPDGPGAKLAAGAGSVNS